MAGRTPPARMGHVLNFLLLVLGSGVPAGDHLWRYTPPAPQKSSGGHPERVHDGMSAISSSFWVRGVWGAPVMLTVSCSPPRFSSPAMLVCDLPDHILLALGWGASERNGYVDRLASFSSFWVRRRTQERTTMRPAILISISLWPRGPREGCHRVQPRHCCLERGSRSR